MPASRSAEAGQDDTCEAENPSQPLSNSERIRRKFGSYGIDVLESSPGIRVSSLYSTHGNEKINRTFAVVAYPRRIENAFRREHGLIISGQSIGIVFSKNGWLIDKHHRYFGEMEIPAGHFHMDPDPVTDGKTLAAVHVYSLVVSKDAHEFQYASIAEVHHPDFLNLEDLKGIYAAETGIDRPQAGDITDFLALAESRILALEIANPA